MPGSTPNRAYPYPLSSETPHTPEAIQALAEAVDGDMAALTAAIGRRPIAMVSSRTSTPQVFPASVTTQARFDFVHIDTAGISNLAAFPTRLTPTSPGFWCFWAAMERPPVPLNGFSTFVRVNGGDLSRSDFHTNTFGSGSGMITNAGMAQMNGTTDYFTFTLNPDGATDDVRIRVKRMGCFRLIAL